MIFSGETCSPKADIELFTAARDKNLAVPGMDEHPVIADRDGTFAFGFRRFARLADRSGRGSAGAFATDVHTRTTYSDGGDDRGYGHQRGVLLSYQSGKHPQTALQQTQRKVIALTRSAIAKRIDTEYTQGLKVKVWTDHETRSPQWPVCR